MCEKIESGDWVKHKQFDWAGRVVSVEGDKATIVNIVMPTPLSNLVRVTLHVADGPTYQNGSRARALPPPEDSSLAGAPSQPGTP